LVVIPAQASAMNLNRAFQLLDLDAGASAETFKKRYHDLAAVWHPDRHAQDDRSTEIISEYDF
jgi:DnaJ-class molecular chaperone